VEQEIDEGVLICLAIENKRPPCYGERHPFGDAERVEV